VWQKYTQIDFGILVLAYYGSKFVLERLLNKNSLHKRNFEFIIAEKILQLYKKNYEIYKKNYLCINIPIVIIRPVISSTNLDP
jgi:hypothetical protein